MRLEKLTEILDPEPHSAAFNMAMDEVLLHGASAPLLRVYRWARPAVSFGYFGSLAEVECAWPGREAVRRWTGGGVVPHGDDLTYTLIFPAGHAFAQIPARDSYRLIHEALAGFLRSAGAVVEIAAVAAAKISSACFENPAEFDLLNAEGKIAGAAQRRTRWGLLHQGSIQVAGLHGAFRAGLAPMLAECISRAEISAVQVAAADALAAEKYGARTWLERFG